MSTPRPPADPPTPSEPATQDGDAPAKAEEPAKTDAPVKAEEPAKADAPAKAEAPAKATAKPAAKPDATARPAAKPASVPAKPAAKAPPAEPAIPSAPPWWKTLRADPPAHIRLVLGVGLIAFVFAIWWFVTRGSAVERIVSPANLQSPAEVFGSFDRLLDRELGKNTIETLERVFKGVLLAAIVGIGLGVVAASHRGVNAALAPLVIFLRSVPMGALIPLTLILFSDGEAQKTRFIFLAIVPFVFSDTVKAVSTVPERYVETAQTLGASNFQIIRKVLVPLALPDIITSLRFQLGLALGYIMLAEEVNAEFGLGRLIMGSQQRGPHEHVFLLLFVIALIAFSIDLILRTLQRGVFPWRRDL